MTSHCIPSFIAFAIAVLSLSACGGGGNDHPAPDTALFAARYNTALTAAGTTAGLTSPTVVDVFDEKYLDNGSSRADLMATLAANSQAAATSADLSLFPTGELTNATLSACVDNVCTLNATLTNTDVDTTTTDFTTKVKILGSVVYLYGDQSATAAI